MIRVGWHEPQDEHADAPGDVPRMPEMPGAEYDNCADRIHAEDMGSIDPFGPSLWERIKAWWRR